MADNVVPFIEKTNGTGDLARGALPLHATGGEDDFHRGMTTLDNVENIADGRASRRGDDSDSLRKPGQRAFAPCGKQAFRIQLLFQALEGGLQRAGPLKFYRRDAE